MSYYMSTGRLPEMIGFNYDLNAQISFLSDILKENEPVYEIIKKASNLRMKHYYITAGCIAQTVWNFQTKRDLMYGISDIDFAYYDDSDLSYEAENTVIEKISSLIQTDLKFDIKNQARVHLWYSKHFGYDIEPYVSVEHAINTYPTSATAIGIRLEYGILKVYAPFGLNDLFGMIVRANKTKISPEIYCNKTEKWKSKWDELTIIPW